jgi:hypothetical protein
MLRRKSVKQEKCSRQEGRKTLPLAPANIVILRKGLRQRLPRKAGITYARRKMLVCTTNSSGY